MRIQLDFNFKIMSFIFKIRDFITPPEDVLKEVGLKLGFSVLDYGCGPGSYILPTERIIGKFGKIYALDFNPSAIKSVQHIAAKKRLENIATILSDHKTGLPNDSADVVLLYDVFHGLNHKDEILLELHRVLKPHGILSFSDHHMNKEEIVSIITKDKLFKLHKSEKMTTNFTMENTIKDMPNS